MLKEWAASGLPPEDFYVQTPKTYNAIMAGVIERARSLRNHRVETAWRTANFVLAGDKLPELNQFLINTSTGEPVDNSTSSETYIDPEPALDAWFNLIESLNGE